MGGDRAGRTRPRYGRMAAALSSLGVTMVALLGGVGVLPSSAGEGEKSAMVLDTADRRPQAGASLPESPAITRRTPDGTPSDSTVSETVTVEPVDSPSYPVPAKSGKGKRVVFSESQQRVWLVRENGAVQRTYLVSGSLTDNLDPGVYAVFSRSVHAWGVNDSGTMKWFVRFTAGDTGAAIGFHDIPVDDGQPVQTLSLLGTPQSHGCIRQKAADAKALWKFAPVHTTVVVTT